MYSNINKQNLSNPPLSMRISDENSKKNNYSPPTPTSQLRRVLSLFVRYHTTPTAAHN